MFWWISNKPYLCHLNQILFKVIWEWSWSLWCVEGTWYLTVGVIKLNMIYMLFILRWNRKKLYKILFKRWNKEKNHTQIHHKMKQMCMLYVTIKLHTFFFGQFDSKCIKFHAHNNAYPMLLTILVADFIEISMICADLFNHLSFNEWILIFF